MLFLPIPQLLGVLGALMIGGQAVLAIQLDLSDTSKILPSLKPRRNIWTHKFLALKTDLVLSSSRLDKASSKHNSLRHDDLLHGE